MIGQDRRAEHVSPEDARGRPLEQVALVARGQRALEEGATREDRAEDQRDCDLVAQPRRTSVSAMSGVSIRSTRAIVAMTTPRRVVAPDARVRRSASAARGRSGMRAILCESWRIAVSGVAARCRQTGRSSCDKAGPAHGPCARGRSRMNRFVIAVVACAYAPEVDDPGALLNRYATPNGWSDALAAAGATVHVVQRLRRAAVLRRGGVDFHLVADGASPSPTARFWGTGVVRAVRALDPAAVHVDGLVFPALVAHLRLALPRRTPILVQDHGGLADPSGMLRTWPRRVLYAAGLDEADGFFFTSREQAVPWRRMGVLAGRQPIHEVPEASTIQGAAGDQTLRRGARPSII